MPKVNEGELSDGTKVRNAESDPGEMLDSLLGLSPREEEEEEEDELSDEEAPEGEDDGDNDGLDPDDSSGEEDSDEDEDGEGSTEEGDDEEAEVDTGGPSLESQLKAALETVNELSKGEQPVVALPEGTESTPAPSQEDKLYDILVPTDEQFEEIISTKEKLHEYIQNAMQVAEQNAIVRSRRVGDEQSNIRRAEDRYIQANPALAPVHDLLRSTRKLVQAQNPKLSVAKALEAAGKAVMEKLQLSAAIQEAEEGPVKLKNKKKGPKKGRHAQRGGASTKAKRAKREPVKKKKTEEDLVGEHIEAMLTAGRP